METPREVCNSRVLGWVGEVPSYHQVRWEKWPRRSSERCLQVWRHDVWRQRGLETALNRRSTLSTLSTPACALEDIWDVSWDPVGDSELLRRPCCSHTHSDPAFLPAYWFMFKHWKPSLLNLALWSPSIFSSLSKPRFWERNSWFLQLSDCCLEV